MAVREFSQTNATGRSGRGLTGSLKKALGPPEGEPWCWLTRELLESDAWCAMSPNLNRLIHFLLVEHMNHAGTENGNLAATYDQLVAYGCTRGRINAAIAEGCYLGLIDADHGGRWAGTNQPSRYRLTFYPLPGGAPPTHRWKGTTAEAAEKWKAKRRKAPTPKTKARFAK